MRPNASDDLAAYIRTNLADCEVTPVDSKDVAAVVSQLLVAAPIVTALWTVLKHWLDSRPRAEIFVTYVTADDRKIEATLKGQRSDEALRYLAANPPKPGASVRLAGTSDEDPSDGV